MAKMEDQSIKITLDFPVDLGEGKTLSSLTIGRLKAKHLEHIPPTLFKGEEAVKNISPSEFIPFIAAVAGIPLEQAKELDVDDLMKVVGELTGFLTAHLGTGKS